MLAAVWEYIVSTVVSIYYFSICATFDFLLYIVVDVVVKTSLRDCRSEAEKRNIWMVESILLLLCTVVIYYLHHTPYILGTLFGTTFLYTQLLGRVDFKYWWNQVMCRWDEFEQHKESMEIFNEMKSWQEKMTASLSQQQPQNHLVPTHSFGSKDHSNTDKGLIANSGFAVPTRFSSDNMTTNRFGLARRPLHSFLGSPSISRVEDESNFSYYKSKFMSAIGMQKIYSHPPGLQNAGENLCFLNSVVQCLSNVPQLLECLLQDRQTLNCTGAQASFVVAIIELMQGLAVPSGYNRNAVLSHQSVREAASQLRSSMIAQPGSSQSQQDAAEFLMWLLGVLHNGMNQALPGSGKSSKYQTMNLEMLRMRYNITSVEKFKELKDSCLKELESAYGLDHFTFADPAYRLSELHWLEHKEHNSSIIDQLFTGQLVEAQLCTACHRISFNCQTFNILPVPIAEAREFNDLTYLEDCLGNFGKVEDLHGSEGLQCECSNPGITTVTGVGGTAVQLSPINGGPPKLTDLHRRRLGFKTPVTKNDISDDSGFHDNNFKTSTPIQQEGKINQLISPPKKRLTDGQRRCMLSNLPDCLIIQLMRFSYSNGQAMKIKSSVNIPIVGLDLTHLLMNNVLSRCIPPQNSDYPTNYRYNLAGVCVHIGEESTSSGHYLAYAKTRNGCWYKFDDSRVSEVNMEYELSARVVRENAYLLFYRRASL